MNATLPLRTARLTLRELQEADWEAVHAYASDLDVVRFMAWGPNSVADTQAFVARAVASQAAKPRSSYQLAVTTNDNGGLIGACGLVVADRESRSGWIGYVFRRDMWGQGFATEAARALLALGFDQLQLHRVFATCDVENLASARVLEKIGMTREGRLREHKWVRGRWRDSYLYAILDPEWDRLQTATIPSA